MWIKQVFKREKPIIGVVHLHALPGAPKNEKTLEEIVDIAVEDAVTYEKGGVDGVIIENAGDVPYFPRRVSVETVAFMTYIASRVKDNIKIPVGINVLRNDAIAAIAIAHAVGGKFIRVNVLTEAVVADQGIIEGEAHKVLRFRKRIGAESIKIMADLRVKHAKPLVDRNIKVSAKDLALRGCADAIILTGETTGVPPAIDAIKNVKNSVEVPVFAGSGINYKNIEEYLKICDGVIVGSSLKEGGRMNGRVELDRVVKLVDSARKVRSLGE